MIPIYTLADPKNIKDELNIKYHIFHRSGLAFVNIRYIFFGDFVMSIKFGKALLLFGKLSFNISAYTKEHRDNANMK